MKYCLGNVKLGQREIYVQQHNNNNINNCHIIDSLNFPSWEFDDKTLQLVTSPWLHLCSFLTRANLLQEVFFFSCRGEASLSPWLEENYPFVRDLKITSIRSLNSSNITQSRERKEKISTKEIRPGGKTLLSPRLGRIKSRARLPRGGFHKSRKMARE